MFYVCQGSCLCGTANSNKGKVIYCYGDLVPRQGELFEGKEEQGGRATQRDLLAAQLGIWVFGLIALLIVLLLIRKSITSLRKHIKKVTERLPWYHDDDLASTQSASSPPPLRQKDTTLEFTVGSEEDGFPHNEDGTGTPSDPFNPDSPPTSLNIRGREGGKAAAHQARRARPLTCEAPGWPGTRPRQRLPRVWGGVGLGVPARASCPGPKSHHR